MRRIDERRHGRPRAGVQPLESWIGLLGSCSSCQQYRPKQRERRAGEGGRHEPPPPTVSTELGAP